jgi:hypothetical protein
VQQAAATHTSAPAAQQKSAPHAVVSGGHTHAQSANTSSPEQNVAGSTHAPSQSSNPWSQAMPQLAPSQVAAPFAGAGHGVHAVPQCAGSASLTHASAHPWNPSAQTTAHAPASQTAVALAGGAGQAASHPPQC